MICNICGKHKATIHVTELIDGKMVEVHLCEKCAHEKDLNAKMSVSLNDLLSGLMEFTVSTDDAAHQLKTQCPGCGLRLKDLQKSGRVGCGQCYQTFAQFLLPLIGKIQGTAQHFGKKPAIVNEALTTQAEIDRYEGILQKQIEEEAFEEAAMTRDKIKSLKEQLKTQAKKPPRKRRPGRPKKKEE